MGNIKRRRPDYQDEMRGKGIWYSAWLEVVYFFRLLTNVMDDDRSIDMPERFELRFNKFFARGDPMMMRNFIEIATVLLMNQKHIDNCLDR